MELKKNTLHAGVIHILNPAKFIVAKMIDQFYQYVVKGKGMQFSTE